MATGSDTLQGNSRLLHRSQSTVLDFLGPCLEMFEEKQLLAVQMQLREQIASEQRDIEEYRRMLAELERSGAKIDDKAVSTESGHGVSEQEVRKSPLKLSRSLTGTFLRPTSLKTSGEGGIRSLR